MKLSVSGFILLMEMYLLGDVPPMPLQEDANPLLPEDAHPLQENAEGGRPHNDIVWSPLWCMSVSIGELFA